MKSETAVTVRYRVIGGATREKTFRSQAAFERWLEKNEGDVEVLAFER